MNKNFRIILKSPCVRTLKSYCEYLKTNFYLCNLSFSIVFLPTKRKLITLLKSPHVFKKSKEQFNYLKYKCLIDIKKNDDISVYNKIFINRPKTVSIYFKTF